MAGSWKHMINDDGTPFDDRFGEGSMLESGGDVAEALEKCYGMVWVLTHWLLPAKATREDALALIEKAQEEYKTGVRLGKNTGW